MEPVKSYPKICIVINVKLQGFLNNVRTAAFCFFGYTVKLIGKLFGKPD